MPRILNMSFSWQNALMKEFEKPYMLSLKAFLKQEKANHKIIYPRSDRVFQALEQTPLENVKVIILGQDPYHRPNQAHGLCFSVLPGIPAPPSLQNIYKELKNDINFKPVKHGYLIHWAKQGVLMLNSILTVEKGQAGAHQGKGWEQFTDRIIAILNQQKQSLVFILWGNYAQKKGVYINDNQHLVLKSAHPSPLSAHHGFFGSHHFSKTNQFLKAVKQGPINWQLPKEAMLL